MSVEIPKILVAESDLQYGRFQAALISEQLEVIVDRADNGLAAQQLCLRNTYDLVIADVSLAIQADLTLIQWMATRRLERVIGMSESKSSADTRFRCLHKPFDGDEFITLVETVLQETNP